MNIDILVGDVLDVPADVLIATANPWLQMTGGVNLAIILRPRGELVHEELQRYLPATGRRMVEPGTVVRTVPGSLPVKHILHAVAIDPSYDSSVELVASTITAARAHKGRIIGDLRGRAAQRAGRDSRSPAGIRSRVAATGTRVATACAPATAWTCTAS